MYRLKGILPRDAGVPVILRTALQSAPAGNSRAVLPVSQSAAMRSLVVWVFEANDAGTV